MKHINSIKWISVILLIAVMIPVIGCGKKETSQKISFESSRDGNLEIYVMNADGTSQTDLTNNPADDRYPSWSPDGSKVVFESFRDSNGENDHSEIYIMNADGTGQTRLTNNTKYNYSWPTFGSWSPDGSKIAFVSYSGNMTFGSSNNDSSEIYIMNPDGTGQTRLTNNLAIDDSPLWSLDGSKIAFVSKRDGNFEIYVMNPDGTGQTRLTNNSANDLYPLWSPSGSKIAFESNRDSNSFQTEIYVMNPDGTGQTRLTYSPQYSPQYGFASLGSWSPDGSKIAFVFYRDLNDEIYIMNADGTGQTRLTNNPGYDWLRSWH